MKHRMLNGYACRRLLIAAARLLFVSGLLTLLPGCATMNRLGDGIRHVLDEFSGRASSTGAPQPGVSAEKPPEVPPADQHLETMTIYSWSLAPEAPMPGETVTSEIDLTVYTPEGTRPVGLKVERVLLTGDERIPLGAVHIKYLKQGRNKLLWRFTLPADIDPGAYELVTTLWLRDKKAVLRNQFSVDY